MVIFSYQFSPWGFFGCVGGLLVWGFCPFCPFGLSWGWSFFFFLFVLGFGFWFFVVVAGFVLSKGFLCAWITYVSKTFALLSVYSYRYKICVCIYIYIFIIFIIYLLKLFSCNFLSTSSFMGRNSHPWALHSAGWALFLLLLCYSLFPSDTSAFGMMVADVSAGRNMVCEGPACWKTPLRWGWV